MPLMHSQLFHHQRKEGEESMTTPHTTAIRQAAEEISATLGPIGYDDALIRIITKHLCPLLEQAEKERDEARRVARWNIRKDGDALVICDGQHEKHQDCASREMRYVPEGRRMCMVDGLDCPVHGNALTQALARAAAAEGELAQCRNAIPFAFIPEAKTGPLVEDPAREWDLAKSQRNTVIIMAGKAEAKLAACEAERDNLRAVMTDIGGVGGCLERNAIPALRVITDLRAKLAEVEKERDALRKSFIYAINHAGGKVSDECSTEFLCMGADQIKLYCDKQRSSYAAVKGEQMELIQARAGYLAERDEARRDLATALSRAEQSEALLAAVRAFLAFGRPKEGSDRYKAAWDQLAHLAPKETT